MKNLELKGGKFYKDGKIMPLEFGNKDQIELMQARLENLKQLQQGTFEPQVDFTTITKVDVNFTCTCGKQVWFVEQEYEHDEDADYIDDFSGAYSKCMKCGQRYEIVINDGELNVKIKA